MTYVYFAGQDDSIYRQGDADTAMGGELAALFVTIRSQTSSDWHDEDDAYQGPEQRELYAKRCQRRHGVI